MKPTMALKPLVFALAAVMAMAAQAGGNDHGNGHGNGHGNHGPKGPTLEQLLQIGAGAGAAVLDEQNSDGNVVKNQGTNNNAKMDNSLNNSNGNMGANVAAGDGNQQDNAAALATADESFIFGTAVAASSATQVNNNNYVKNSSTFNNATLNNAGNNGSGNIGINVTAGNFNQQKNNLAIAVSGGRVAVASAAANQSTSGLSVNNKADRTYTKETLGGAFAAYGQYEGEGHGYVERKDDKPGHNGGWDDRGGNKPQKDKLTFTEEGSFVLGGVYTYQVLKPTGWANPVVNNANMSNSLNGVSGNVGANVSAGSGNQQSNSLAISNTSF